MLYLMTFIIPYVFAGNCYIHNSPGMSQDYLKSILQTTACPANVQELKALFNKDKMKAIPAMVANRGFHNPEAGSFSIFESVQGYSELMKRNILPEHLYFGHFTTIEGDSVILDQENSKNKLLIELMAYDFRSNVYNFYELIGGDTGPKWFYRGNSFDIFEDNKFLKISNPSRFGNKLRCSACHSSGGPIMKEMAFPHNDWWTNKDKLLFGTNRPSDELNGYMKHFVDASVFSNNVVKGIRLLEKKKIWVNRSMREKLRPLFCSTEINLVSDNKKGIDISISSAVFVDPLLFPETTLKMNRPFYESALRSLGSRFPENGFIDSAHAFLAPRKSEQTTYQVEVLLKDRIVDEEFALDVLSVDFENPLFSELRCSLLRFVPESGNWKEEFINNLVEARFPDANNFLINNAKEHKQRAAQYIKDKISSWKAQVNVKKEIIKLNDLRLSVFKDDISKNPRGQILEPGFRVIFPIITAP